MKEIFIHLVLFFALFFIANNSNAQNAGIRTDGVNLNISASTALIILGNVKINGGSDYILNNGNCYIAGNFTNAGASFSTAGTGTEIFNGTSTISGTSNFNNLTIVPGATVTLASSIDIKNDWNNTGKFVHGSNIVNISGSVPVQYIIGSGTFYKLTLQNSNSVNFGSSNDTIENSFSNSTGSMVDGTSKVVFKNNSGLIGNNNKNFYDLEVLTGANVSHTTGPSNIHVAHSFVNNGTLSENATYTFFFDSTGGSETMSGAGNTIFGNLTIGGPVLSFPTSVNTGTSNFTIAGDALKFNSNNSSLISNGTVTFVRSVSGTTTIQNASGVTGTSASLYNALVSTPSSVVTTALNPGSNIAVFNNNLTINDNGSIAINAPLYGSSATLIYNTTNAALPTNFEWNTNITTPGLGIPKNVIIQNTNNILLAGDRGLNGNLNILTGDALNINNHTLTLNGTVTGTGLLTGSSTSNITIGSSGALGTLYFDQATNNTTNVLKDFTINSGSVLLGNPLNITAGTATSTYGTVIANGTLDANGMLTLKSNQYGDAIIGQSSGTVLNNTTVERFIPARRAWRFLSVPIKPVTQTINAVWQEGGQNPDLIYANHQDPNLGYGTDITYDNLLAHGYDYNTTTNPSIKVWDASTNNWSATIPYTNSTYITDYPAYCLFVRGSRAVDLSQGIYAPVDNTVLRITGNLNTGNSTKMYNTTAGNAVLVSNPYASPVNIVNMLAANTANFTANKFWVWDPAFGGSYNVGGYITYNSGIMVPAGSSYSGDKYAQSGQAFMLEAKNTGTYGVSFIENNKTATETNVFGRQSQHVHPAIYTNLMVSSVDSLVLVDGVAAAFAYRFSAKVDADDAQKLWNVDENIALVRNEARLSIELRPLPVLSDTLFYKLFLYYKPYVLKIFSQDLLAKTPLQGWLIDKYLNTKTAVNLYDTTLYNFTPVLGTDGKLDTNSYRNRFMLVFNRTFTGTPVEVTKVISQDDPGTTGNAAGIAEKESGVSIYPNPVITGSKAMVIFSNVAKGSYEVTISNVAGETVTTKTILHNGGSNTYSVQTGTGWAADSYIVKITGETGHAFTTKLVVSK